MEKGYIITDRKIFDGLKYLDWLDVRMEDLTLSEDVRRDELLRWQGARRILRHMGLGDMTKFEFQQKLFEEHPDWLIDAELSIQEQLDMRN